MGNLGFDTRGDELTRRAKAVLSEAGISSDTYKYVHGTRLQGSPVELSFVSHDALLEARSAVRNLCKVLEEHNVQKQVWLDVQKTRGELRPGRIAYKVFEYVQHLEESRPTGKLEVTYERGPKIIKVGKQTVVFMIGDVIKPTLFARNGYEDDEVRQMFAFASNS